MCAVKYISIRCMTVYMYMYNIIYTLHALYLILIQMSCSDFSLRDSCIYGYSQT